ncbi:Uncharacterised protein [Salmonella enterica]|nr:Uncharacterised protein [Salmonella enterica]
MSIHRSIFRKLDHTFLSLFLAVCFVFFIFKSVIYKGCVRFLCTSLSILVIRKTILKFFIFYRRLFNIGEVLNNIESYEEQDVTFSILVINVLFPNLRA